MRRPCASAPPRSVSTRSRPKSLHPDGEQPGARHTAPLQVSQSYKNGEKAGTLAFTRVFDEDIGQEALFTGTFLPAVSSAVREGQNGLLFAYGQWCGRGAPPLRHHGCLYHFSRRHDERWQDVYHHRLGGAPRPAPAHAR